MKQYKKVVVIVAILLALIAVVWYHMPIEKQVSATLCSVDGELMEVELDVSWYRYLLAPTELKGTVTIDDVVYERIKVNDEDGFIEKIKKKIENKTTTPWFGIASANTAIDYHKNCIFLEYVQKNSEVICMVVVKDGTSMTYYGPAYNAEEAKAIRMELGTEK